MSRYQSEAPEGRPTHTPSIRIRGVDTGSPQYNALVDQHRGALRQFHASQQQQVKLSGQRIYKASKHIPGAHLTYHNNEGQETITMAVDTAPGGREEEVPRETPWEFALVEFVIPSVGTGLVHMAAFLAKPQTAEEKAITAGTFLPVQGVSLLGAFDADKPILAFAWNVASDVPQVARVVDNDFTASLRVDLGRFPFQVIEIDVHGYIEPYNKTGGTGEGSTEILASTFYGTLTRRYDTVNPRTPDGLANAPRYLNIDPALTGFGHERLVDTFPELASVDFQYSGTGHGESFAIAFDWDTIGHAWVAETPTISGTVYSASPNNDPNAFIISPVNPSTTVEYWSGSYEKKNYPAGGNGEIGLTLDGSPTTPPIPNTSPPLGAGSACVVTGDDDVHYSVPTWRFAGPAPITVRAVCARQGNPWTVVSYRDTQTTNDGQRWEVTAAYPARPKMKQLDGSFSLPSQDEPSFPGNTLAVKFGMPLIGRLKIDTRSGGVKFEAA